jgi:hypothetical protein
MSSKQKVMLRMEKDHWAIDGLGNCGNYFFKDCILIVEPLSTNPGILIQKPFGLRGLKEALELIEIERQHRGIITVK